MSGLRERITEALRELDYEDTGGDLSARSSVSLERWADVLLSLPGIAVVESVKTENLREALQAFDEYAPTTFADYKGVALVINTARALLADGYTGEIAAESVTPVTGPTIEREEWYVRPADRREAAIAAGRLAHIRELCEYFTAGGTVRALVPTRGWLARSVLNILDGNSDEQIRQEAGLDTGRRDDRTD